MEDTFERGVAVRTELFGDERTRQALAVDDPLAQAFQTQITAYCFGDLWGRQGVAWRDRSLMTMAIVAAQHRFAEFETHCRLALRNGCEQDTLIELVRHLTVYCGVPTGGEAFRTLQRVLQEAAAKES